LPCSPPSSAHPGPRGALHGETDWHAGDVVDAPEYLARELVAHKRAAFVDDVPALGPLTSGPTGTITNRAADVESRDPAPAKRGKK
jgi:hypothetical protein